MVVGTSIRVKDSLPFCMLLQLCNLFFIKKWQFPFVLNIPWVLSRLQNGIPTTMTSSQLVVACETLRY
uniref:Uncharacterized protein n=1 Tax=Rhizophora mucronata TaxID=61149 RepID=A0A2P2L669_RHIMU